MVAGKIFGRAVMSTFAIQLLVALTSTGAGAQDAKSGRSDTRAADGTNGTQPFLFDGRMRGDGVRQQTAPNDHRPNAGAIVMPPKASPPARE